MVVIQLSLISHISLFVSILCRSFLVCCGSEKSGEKKRYTNEFSHLSRQHSQQWSSASNIIIVLMFDDANQMISIIVLAG